ALHQGTYITTLSLQHVLFYQSDTNGVYPAHNHRPTEGPDIVYVIETPSNSLHNPNNINSYIDKNNEHTSKPDGQYYLVQYNGRPEYQSPDIYPESYPDFPFNQPDFIIDPPPERQTTKVPAIGPTTIRPTTAMPRTTLPPVPIFEPDPINDGSSSDSECGISTRNDPNSPIVPLIVKGETFERGEWPWLVAIFRRKFSSLSYICAGTLVSDRHVIT
ncbi:jg449, partial [Pararge aegeria aegeria]